MKTAVTVLQEMMVKLGETPDYECISQSGPQHQALFEYRCCALGATVTAAARSKKEAKQEAARLMLQRLASAGRAVPPPYGPGAAAAPASPPAAAPPAPLARSYVALLKELCDEYRLPAPAYELVADTGPPHLRHFTVTATVGHLTRHATATTKKAARQLAAEQLYSYLRENLARLTKDFVEEEALVRAHEKAMERYQEVREERRPDLGQRVSDYHLGGEARAAAERALAADADAGALEDALAALGLTATAATLDADDGPVFVVRVEDAKPPLAFAGKSAEKARADAVRYLRRALRQRSPAGAAQPV